MTESHESEPSRKRGFASNRELARQAGNDPKSEMRRYIQREREERQLRRSLGREPTPEERLADQLSRGSALHRQDGNDEMADKHTEVAKKLAEGQLDVFGAYEELGSSTDLDSSE